jgi:hypothetical protein
VSTDDLNADNATIAVTGAVFVCEAADLATITMPAKFNDALVDEWLNLGLIGPDGLEEGKEDDRKTFYAWQGGQIVRVTTATSATTYKFAMLESKRQTQELYYKGSKIVTVAGSGNGYQLDILAPQPDKRAFVFDIIDGDNADRHLVEKAEVSDRSAIKRVSDDLTLWEVTITAYPVSGGRVARQFSNRASWAPAA